MKDLFKSSRFKLIIVIIALLLVGMTLCAANGHGETAQSGIIGTIFTPAHWVASKISNGIDSFSDSAKGNAEYDASYKTNLQITTILKRKTIYIKTHLDLKKNIRILNLPKLRLSAGTVQTLTAHSP